MKNQLFKSTWGAFMNNWAFFRRSGRYKVRNYSGGRLEKSIFLCYKERPKYMYAYSSLKGVTQHDPLPRVRPAVRLGGGPPGMRQRDIAVGPPDKCGDGIRSEN